MDTRLALCDARGPLADLLEKLSGEDGEIWLRGLNKFLRKEESWRTDFARDMSKEGWTLLEDTREPWPISVSDLKPVPFLHEGEDYVGGEDMVRRSREELHANLGQRHAEYLLENHNEIPEELRKFVLVFPGTIWRSRYGNRSVPCLDWDDGQWQLSFRWLENGFFFDSRLLRPRK